MQFDRHLSLLQFQWRVLAQAQDKTLPLLERLKFLAICSSNLDEFFETHVASLKEKSQAGLLSTELLSQISEQSHQLVHAQYDLLQQELLPALIQEHIHIVEESPWSKVYFKNELLPILSPIGLDPAHPFPRTANKSLHFIVALQGTDAFGREVQTAIVPAPQSVPRFIRIPKSHTQTPNEFIPLASVIKKHIQTLFPNMIVRSCYSFRVTRNSNLFIDEEEVDDLLLSLEGELPARRYGESVRLEIDHNCPQNLVQFLQHYFALKPEDTYPVPGWVNLSRLISLYEEIDRTDLKYPILIPTHPLISFESLQKNDLLLLHPFESFASILDFIKQAIHDPDVLVIKQILYRTGHDSILGDYLVQAAQAGKEVTVVIELRARFDEETNIELANRLQEAGAHVVYGIVGYKTHAKILMIVRREGQNLKRYIHLGTGNYHPKTTRQYVDYSFLTSNPDFAEDVHHIFMQLTGLSKQGELLKCLEAPFSMKTAFLNKIKREISYATQGKPAQIKAKMNALADTEIIEALEKAAQAGVDIQLIIRGICCLQPQKNIRIRSVLGRFLEHDRVYYFANNKQPELYLASADWMTRNLSQRIELAFPIENQELQKRIIYEAFELYWLDNAQSFDLQIDGQYVRPPLSDKVIRAQEELLHEISCCPPHKSVNN